MKKDNQVTIVVPNYNGMAFVEACLKALRLDAPSAKILLVDNGSEDGSREWVEEHFPEVEVLALEKNYGFSRAVNEGIRAADTPYVILLNNDTEVLSGFTDALVQAVSKDERIFSAAARMIQLHDKTKLDDAGDFYCALGWHFARGKGKPVDAYGQSEEIFAACAGAAIYRKAVFEKIGCFDEEHFAYLEDIDVGYRARIAGYRNVYEPAANVYHAGSGTSGSRYNDFKVTLSARNSIYLIYKNMPFLQILLNLPFFLVGFGIKYLFFLRKGFGKIYRKGLGKGFSMCRKRKKVKFYWKNMSHYVKIQISLWVNIGKRFR